MTCASKKEDELIDHNNYELFFRDYTTESPFRLMMSP
jgi:hypothetical protein